MAPTQNRAPSRPHNTITRQTRTYRVLLNQLMSDMVNTKGIIPVYTERPIVTPARQRKPLNLRQKLVKAMRELPGDALDAGVLIFGLFGLCMAIATALILIGILIVHGLPIGLWLAK